MKKKNITLISSLMAFALLGVMAMQFYFLRQSYGLQSSLFDSSVREALNAVVAKINAHDANNFLKQKIKAQTDTLSAHPRFIKKLTLSDSAENAPIISKHKITIAKHHNITREQRIAELQDSLRRLNEETKLDNIREEVNGRFSVQVRIEEYTDEYGNVRQNYIPLITPKPIDQREYTRTNGKLHKYLDTTHIVYVDPQFGRQVISVPHLNPAWIQEQARKKKELQVKQQVKQIQKLLQIEAADTPTAMPLGKSGAIENLAREYQRANEPLKERINPFWLDTLLRTELHNRGIDLLFSYDVSTLHSDSLIFSKASDITGAKPVFLANETYQSPIFNSEVVSDPGNLKLAFPAKNSLILSHMAASMGTTAGLLFVLIFCFGYTIYSILRQKKISEMKTDFINNMTHEFKTPVSTIMIASEALKDDEIAQDKSRVARLANIIYDENVRLGSHIERVLNIARIERNDFRMDIKPVEINEMIAAVLDSMQLKLQKHDAKIDLNLSEEELTIKADELHFSNVIYNLVDNAIKYSANAPEITITTFGRNGQAVIKVADKGIGMSSDQQAKIFEQFYRIPTGNLHDVKGFGLGLSYVNTIVKRLNGTISVKSERDKGSEFELKFDKSRPLNQPDHLL